MIVCTHCGYQFSAPEAYSREPIRCPNCGSLFDMNQPKPDSSWNVIQNYLRNLRQLITQPSFFFKKMPTQGGMNQALCFALVTHWLGVSIGYLWKVLIGKTIILSSFFNSLEKLTRHAMNYYPSDQYLDWFFNTGQVIADPFLTLFKITIGSLIVFIGVRIFAPFSLRENTHLKQFGPAVQVICYGLAPSIFSILPGIGAPVSSIWIFITTLIGIREVYKVSLARAFMIVLFPKIIFLGILGLGLLFFTFTLFKIIVLTLSQ